MAMRKMFRYGESKPRPFFEHLRELKDLFFGRKRRPRQPPQQMQEMEQ